MSPFPSEHSCRLRDPGDFDSESFKRTSRDHEGKKYDIIIGKLDGEDTMTEQAYRYPIDGWESADAKSHCAVAKGAFEEAAGGEEEDEAEEGKGIEHATEMTRAYDDAERAWDESGVKPRADGKGIATDTTDTVITTTDASSPKLLAELTEDDDGVTSRDKRFVTCGFNVTSVDRAERTIVFAINSDHVDRDKEVVRPQGVGLKNYRENPVVLYGHNYDSLPVAKSLWIRKVKEEGRTLLLSKAKFATTQFASDVFDLAADGFLRTASIGFIPEDFRGRAPTDEEIKAYPDWARAERVYDKCDLLEWSIVPVPSNPYALSRSVMAGKVKLPAGFMLSADMARTDGQIHLPWTPETFVGPAHEATFGAIDDYVPGAWKQTALTLDEKSIVEVHGQGLKNGASALYKRFYMLPEWTAEQALPQAVDEKCISFVPDAERVHRLSPVAPKSDVDMSVTRVVASSEEPEMVRRITTTETVKQIERERARGRVIF